METKESEPQERKYLKSHVQDTGKGLLAGVLAFMRAHLGAIFLFLCLLLVTSCAFFGWRYYQYRQSGVFAFVSFSGALQPPSAEKLAKLIDFNRLSGQLARSIALHYAYLKKGPDQIRDLQDMIQMSLLQRAMSKEEPVKGGQTPRQLLQKPLTVLPDDFLTQFAKNLTVHSPPDSSEDNACLLSSSVEHPMLDASFPVVLRMDKSGGGWMIRDVVNSDELVKLFRLAQLKRMAARRDELLKKRTETVRRMNGLIALKACSAGVEKLSDGKTFLLVASVLGRNVGELTVNNTNMEVVFSSGNGNELLRRNINVAQPVSPGEDYNQRWSLDFEQSDALGQRILKAGGIVCDANWHSMGLANGEVLYLAEFPELVEDFQ
jgi:hypothetical protein